MAKKRRGRGEGGIEELPSGAFRAVVSLGLDPVTKKRVREAATFATKREALEWREETSRKFRRGDLSTTTTALTVDEWLTTWLEIRKNTAAAGTYRTERSTLELRLRPHLGAARIRDLKPLALERWLAKLGTDGVTTNERKKAAVLLRLVFNDAVRKKVINSSPMKGVAIPKHVAEEVVTLDVEQLRAMLTAADAAGHGAMFRLWADAGLRPGELYGLQWGDFDPVAGSVSVVRAVCSTSGLLKPPKTKRGRRAILIAPSTVAALLALRPDQVSKIAPMFPTPRSGSHWTNQNFTKYVFNPVAVAAGISAVAYPYILRHTSATHLLQRGVSLKVVSHRLGHEDEVITLKTYAHVLPGMQEAAAVAMESILNPPAKVDDSSAA